MVNGQAIFKHSTRMTVHSGISTGNTEFEKMNKAISWLIMWMLGIDIEVIQHILQI